ncbi:vacuolar protein sorting 55 [Histomonas meleagridis]|uniref:vacuolar protein sorting 55 n=1 Tax=Histomonas meleagridis TaxID=135588 RepID=UPI003559673E|nr:vacuolar protein sorting 55 [Histomonas meleagridis]KAH0804129.1 vacuolar protein sorting 55 [Histomonas meleagridis]
MVQQSVPYIIIACAVVVGVVMCIGGCIADKCWYSLFMIIPAACAVFFGYGYYIKSADETEGGWVTASGLLFMVVASMTSLFALPIILWHVGTIRVVSLGLTLGGALVIVIGAGIFLGLVLQDDYGQPLCCHKDY